MSETIPVANYNNTIDRQPDLGYTIYPDPDHPGFVRVDTSEYNDNIELIWHEDGTLTIVINGETAIRLDAIQAQKVLIDSNGGNDEIFVTGDTPSGNTLRLHGGDDDDLIVGSDGNEQLEGGKGRDTLWGMGGDDILYGKYDDNGNDGNVDILFGGDGDDILNGGTNDRLHGNAGRDTFHGSGVIQFWGSGDVNATGSHETKEVDDEHSDDTPEFASESNADNVPSASGVAGAEPPAADPVDSDETTTDAAADTQDLGPGAPPDDSPVAEPPIGNENMEVPEEPPVPSGVTAEEQPQLIFDQLREFYLPTIEDLNQATEDCLAQAQLAADAGDMDAAKAWAAKADWYASQAERLSAAADVRFGIAVMPEDSDSVDGWFEEEYETVVAGQALAADARATADEAALVAEGDESEGSEGVESEGSESESASDEASASESDETAAASSPDLPSTLPGGDTAAGQVFHFHDQLTGFYAEEIAQALDNTQTFTENAETAAASGDTEGAQRWARMALRESARADQLLQEAKARLDAAEQQLNEVLNDPDASDADKAMAQQQFDEAKLAVETAETQATEAAGLAEEARVAAGLPEDDDGSVPSAEDATTEPGAEATESEAEGATGATEDSDSEAESATAGAAGAEPGAEGEESGSEDSEATGAAATDGSESSEDPYDEAMDNASEGTALQESDRQTSRSRSGNFLLAMAEAQGLMQAKFLGNAMKNLDIMDNLSSTELPEGDADAERQHREAFLIAQSRFQADMQMFNIVSQASATSLRSTGEGMAAVVRKN